MNVEKNLISIIIPAKGEEHTIKDVVKQSKKFSSDVIVALSKYSSNKIEHLLKQLNIRVIMDNGGGKGEAIRMAGEIAKNPIIVFLDADGSHIPEDIPKIIAPIKEKRADMVIGSRILAGSEEWETHEKLRMALTKFISKIISLRFGVDLKDTQNGFRAIKRDVFKQLHLTSKHVEIETEITTKCLKHKYRVIEIPSRELKRRYGKSNVILLRDGWKCLFVLFKNII